MCDLNLPVSAPVTSMEEGQKHQPRIKAGTSGKQGIKERHMIIKV